MQVPYLVFSHKPVHYNAPWVFCLFATERVLIWFKLSVLRCERSRKPLSYLKTVCLHFCLDVLIILRITSDPRLASVDQVTYLGNCSVKMSNNYWLQWIKNNVNNLLVASRSILYRSRRLRQIIDLRDTEKSGALAITEFSNCFIIWFKVCIHI